jgi:hypothetical protein
LKGRRAHIVLTGLLFTVMFIVVGGNSARGQRVYADASSKGGSSIIVPLYSVAQESNAILSPYTDFSTLSLTLSVAGLFNVYQNIKFTGLKPSTTTPLTIKFGTSGSGIANVIGNIELQPTNNDTPVGSVYSLGSFLNLLQNTTDAEITLPGAGVTHDGIRYKVSSTLALGLSGRLWYAFFISPPIITSPTICSGSTATLTVTNPQSGYTYNWYDSGGTLIPGVSGPTYTTTALTSNTSYSVEAVETATGTSYFSAKVPISVTTTPLPSASNAGTNQSWCQLSTVTLNGNSPTVGTGTWSKISGPTSYAITNANLRNTTVTGLVTGTYVFRWTISNTAQCTNSSDVTIDIGAPVSTSVAGTAQSLCAATGTTMAANAPTVGTGTWTQVSGPSTAVFTNANLNNTTVTGLVTGDYVFRWTISSGSCTTSASTVNVKITANPTTANAGADQNLCNVTTTTLAGNTATVGTGTWTRISGPNTPTITAPNASNSGLTGMIPGTYVYRWTIANAPCTDSFDEVSITISAPPTTSNAGPNQLLCSLTSTTLAGNSPSVGTGAWSWVSGPNTPVITTPAANNSTVTGMIAGTYVLRWTISNGGCTASTSDVTIVVSTTPTITLGTAPSACREIISATMIYTGTTGSPVTYSITWGASALTAGFTNVSNASLPSSPINLTVPGTGAVASYSGSITVKNAAGCESTSVPFSLTIHPKPAAPHIITQ